MGRALDLHPLTVITVILAAGSIAGFLGILFAVPFYAVIKTIIIHFYQTYVIQKKIKRMHYFNSYKTEARCKTSLPFYPTSNWQ